MRDGRSATPRFDAAVDAPVMTNLTISELLMLTCCGAFIASVTYAVKLSIEAF